MNTLRITEPIWNGGKRAVGIALFRLHGDYVNILIDYTDKHNSLVYPSIYRFKCSNAVKYPRRRVRNNVELAVVPIDDLEVVGMRNL